MLYIISAEADRIVWPDRENAAAGYYPRRGRPDPENEI